MSTKNNNFGIARVTLVDYEEHFVSLRIVGATPHEFDRVAVPLPAPGAGARHYFGSLPEVGDYCVVGFMPQESDVPNGTKIPIILNWIVPGVWTARDWETVVGFPIEEADLGNVKERGIVDGVYNRVRHKLRHGQPGNIIGCSSQGADLILDESVTLANRRGGELRLRDQDNALVTRSLQQFHAMAGVRSYHGMVQRDATALPASMVSDGKQWDGPLQMVNGAPLHERDLPDSIESEGFLTPARILARGEKISAEGFLGAPLHSTDGHLDPYVFLKNGGFIDEAGFATNPSLPTYGGKPLFRVAKNGQNGALDPDAETFTEYRIEVANTSKGRLPVTEQTDLFDADRLPTSDLDTRGGQSQNRPHVESVLGTVVGNDPFSLEGRRQYGVPLVAKLFDGPTVNPRLEAAVIGSGTRSQIATPVSEYMASLFRLSPLDGSASSFVAWNKKGQLKAFVGGAIRETSAEVALAGGLRLSVGGKLELSLDQGIAFRSSRGDAASNVGLDLGSDHGSVRIFGGGSKKGSESAIAKDGISVEIEAASGMRLSAQRKLKTQAQNTEMQGNALSVVMGETIELLSGNRMNVSAQEMVENVTGRKTELFSGPRWGLPTSGPLHEVTYAPSLPNMVAQKTTFVQGSREELFQLGDHTTRIDVGNARFEATTGKITHKSGQNSTELKPDGLNAQVAVGNMTLVASAGSAEFRGFTGVTVASETGTATVRGRSVYLGAPIVGPDMGGIICSGSLDPLTGLPFAFFGMGAANHIVGV
jgi:hypothetical protein